MARLVSVGRRELSAAEQAMEVYEREIEDVVIPPEKDARIRAALDLVCDAADLSDQVMTTARAVIESGTESRRARRALTEWPLIHGGLSDRQAGGWDGVERRRPSPEWNGVG
jgi:hypothetical protein